MCTIAILFRVADVPLVIAANRDELYARPTRPPEVLGPAIVGGVDALSGGTWLAVNRAGRFAAVTNQRALDTPPGGLRSRGLAVKELAMADDQDAYVEREIEPRIYASMNLVWGDAERVSVAYLRREANEKIIERLEPGVHVLCNDRLGATDFPRGDRLHAAITKALEHSHAYSELVKAIEIALRDHTRVALEDTPPSHLPPELGRELTAACIHSEHYGTRSSTLIAIDKDRVVSYLHADGSPCTAAYEDRLELLDGA
ncbi:MAG TPA: NRDE family protein [Kofleriaceae bacterium]